MAKIQGLHAVAGAPSPETPRAPSLRHPAVLAATWFGVGFLPRAPGTWASLAALPLGWYLHVAWGPLGVAAAAIALFAAGWWASELVVRLSGEPDPAYIVIDEVAGQLVALAVAPTDLLYYTAAFVGFRFFDIVKPWPVSWADRRVAGGLGVMLDDILAGLYVAAILFAVSFFDAV